jgi:hypothetical protein
MQQSISIQFNIVIKLYIFFINNFYYFDIKNKKIKNIILIYLQIKNNLKNNLCYTSKQTILVLN